MSGSQIKLDNTLGGGGECLILPEMPYVDRHDFIWSNTMISPDTSIFKAVWFLFFIFLRNQTVNFISVSCKCTEFSARKDCAVCVDR